MPDVNKQVFILIALTAGAVVALASFGWVLFHFSSYADLGQEKVYETQLRTYVTSSDTYIAKLGFYTGLCDSIGLEKDFMCEADESRFRIAVPVREGYFCVDDHSKIRYYDKLGGPYTCQP